MKNTIKILGIISLILVIGFSMAACSDPKPVPDTTNPDTSTPDPEPLTAAQFLEKFNAANANYVLEQSTSDTKYITERNANKEKFTYKLLDITSNTFKDEQVSYMIRGAGYLESFDYENVTNPADRYSYVFSRTKNSSGYTLTADDLEYFGEITFTPNGLNAVTSIEIGGVSIPQTTSIVFGACGELNIPLQFAAAKSAWLNTHTDSLVGGIWERKIGDKTFSLRLDADYDLGISTPMVANNGVIVFSGEDVLDGSPCYFSSNAGSIFKWEVNATAHTVTFTVTGSFKLGDRTFVGGGTSVTYNYALSPDTLTLTLTHGTDAPIVLTLQ